MKQYLQLLTDIKEKGTLKDPARENMPKTLSLFGTRIEHDMSEGFPLLTTKKMAFKAIVVELLWFLRGDTNIKFLVDNGCNIWNLDSYRWYLKKCEESNEDIKPITFNIFEKYIKSGSLEELIERGRGTYSHLIIPKNYTVGDLGKVYGYNWRSHERILSINAHTKEISAIIIDQVKDIFEGLKENPMSRYHILDAWDKATHHECALPPCHLLYQFNCREISKKDRLGIALDRKLTFHNLVHCHESYNDLGIPRYTLDLQMYQRSADSFLGLPFNIASISLLLQIMAKAVNMIPGKIIWIGGDTHIYENHMDQVNEQLTREPLSLPTVKINKDINSLEDIEKLEYSDFELVDYKSHPSIKGELSVGL